MVSKALEIWDTKLKRPEKKGIFSIERLKESNLLLTKDQEGKIGFIVENTLLINNQISLKNFEIIFHEQLFNPKSKKYHRNCLLVLADKNVNPEFLIRILVGLLEESLSEKITSKDLIGILKKVSETFDLISNNKEEIIGAWGELYFLNVLIQTVKNDISAQSKIIKSWESVLGRKKIDFRFHNSKIAIKKALDSIGAAVQKLCRPDGCCDEVKITVEIGNDKATNSFIENTVEELGIPLGGRNIDDDNETYTETFQCAGK